MAKKRGRRRTYLDEEEVRSDTDFGFRLRNVRADKMSIKYERVERFIRKGLASLCRAIKAIREDPDREKKIEPFLGNIPDAWIGRYGRIRQSAIKNLRIGRKNLSVYSYDDILDDVMLAFKWETGLSEEFKNERMEDIAPLFGITLPQDAQSADAV